MAVPGGNVDVDLFSGDLLVGYRHNFGNGHITGLIGGAYKNYDQSPRNPNSENHGGEGGVKGLVDINAKLADHVPANLMGSYSTAFDSYRARATVGYDFGAFTFGPEGILQGNQDAHQYKIGGVVSGVDLGFAKAKADLGYVNNTERGGDNGVYGGFGFSKDF